MSAPRGEFSSRWGYILAASGSAVGLGNVWGFPTQAASNGGGAFLVVYLLLTFFLAYPAFMAEMIIGRYAKSNSVAALRKISSGSKSYYLGSLLGYGGIATASLILCFYAIIAGWMIAFMLAAGADLTGSAAASSWLTTFGLPRNLVFTVAFFVLTVFVVIGGVQNGIEKWSTRLMPILLSLLVILIIYVMTLDGASDGLRLYLLPDFSKILKPDLILGAMGQSFFSLSIGVGSMMIYGSYLSRKENLPRTGLAVTLIDIGIASMAGLLIIPSMFVAQNNGVSIFDANGALISSDALIFTVLPALFDTMGSAGAAVGLVFFALMSIAALTSSISMLEVPVAYTVETHNMSRQKATTLIAVVLAIISLIIAANFGLLFGWVVQLTTEFSQPLLALIMCLFAGWVWHRSKVLAEIEEGFPEAAGSWFWKIWHPYIRYICPIGILAVFVQSL